MYDDAGANVAVAFIQQIIKSADSFGFLSESLTIANAAQQKQVSVQALQALALKL
jgi:hypothetical protein